MKRMTYFLLGIGSMVIFGTAAISQADCPAVSPCPVAQVDTSKANDTAQSAYVQGIQPAVSPSLQPKLESTAGEDRIADNLVGAKQPAVSPLI